MGLLAVAALREVRPDALAGELAFLSVIEEECTGNGTLAAARAGVLGDAVVVLEPTDLSLLLGGVGMLWIEIEITGVPAHAESADRAVNPVRLRPGDPARAGRVRERDQRHRRPCVRPGGPALQRERGHARGPATGRPACPGRAAAAGSGSGSPAGWTPDEAFEQAHAAVLGPPTRGWPSTRPRSGQRVPRRGLPARRGAPAGQRDGRRARGGARQAPPRGVLGSHHGRADLPEPVRRARAVLRARGPQHPRHRRGGRTGQHRGRGAGPGPVHRRLSPREASDDRRGASRDARPGPRRSRASRTAGRRLARAEARGGVGGVVPPRPAGGGVLGGSSPPG